MEVVVPISPAQDFYMSAPSSPKPFGDPFDYYYHHASAPTSPTRAAAIYAHFSNNNNTSSPTFLSWDEKPGDDAAGSFDFDFSFNFGGQMQKGSPTAADELFEAGRIRSLKPPPPLHRPMQDEWRSRVASSPRSPKSPGSRGSGDRGRERVPASLSGSSSRSRRRESRSLSPLRGGGVFQKTPDSSPPSTSTTTCIKGGGSKRWSLKDLFLFRSASEGRATGRGSKDTLRKYTMLPSSSSSNKRSAKEEPRNASFRSTGNNSSTARGTKGGAAVSIHEKHYTASRAASEELRKKTPLPYHRHGLFGNLRFNPAIHSIARRFNGSLFSRGRDS